MIDAAGRPFDVGYLQCGRPNKPPETANEEGQTPSGQLPIVGRLTLRVRGESWERALTPDSFLANLRRIYLPSLPRGLPTPVQ